MFHGSNGCKATHQEQSRQIMAKASCCYQVGVRVARGAQDHKETWKKRLDPVSSRQKQLDPRVNLLGICYRQKPVSGINDIA